MAFELLCFAAVLATAAAGLLPAAPIAYHAAPAPVYAQPAPVAYAAPLPYAAPIAKAVVAKTIDADFDPNPQYSYSYDVQDALTGDNKQQHESRNGDAVQGSYSLIEADGSRRIVEYTADPVNGFNAVVHKEPAGIAVKAVAAPVVAKYAAPVVTKYAGPIAHATLI